MVVFDRFSLLNEGPNSWSVPHVITFMNLSGLPLISLYFKFLGNLIDIKLIKSI